MAARHLKDGHLVLYDITSSYFEGAYSQSDIVTFGYNRDGKRGHEQMVIALLCSAEGCTVGVATRRLRGAKARRVSDFWSAPAQNLTRSPAQNAGRAQRRSEHA